MTSLGLLAAFAWKFINPRSFSENQTLLMAQFLAVVTAILFILMTTQRNQSVLDNLVLIF